MRDIHDTFFDLAFAFYVGFSRAAARPPQQHRHRPTTSSSGSSGSSGHTQVTAQKTFVIASITARSFWRGNGVFGHAATSRTSATRDFDISRRHEIRGRATSVAYCTHCG